MKKAEISNTFANSQTSTWKVFLFLFSFVSDIVKKKNRSQKASKCGKNVIQWFTRRHFFLLATFVRKERFRNTLAQTINVKKNSTFAQGVILNQFTVCNKYIEFSHDVMAAILVFQNNDTRPSWCSKPTLLKTLFLCKRFLFFLNICKDAGHVSEKALASLLDNQFPASLFLPSSEALGTRLAFW